MGWAAGCVPEGVFTRSELLMQKRILQPEVLTEASSVAVGLPVIKNRQVIA